MLDYSLTMPCESCFIGEEEDGLSTSSFETNNADKLQWKRIQEDHKNMEFREKQRFRVCLPNQKNKRS